MIPNYFCWSKFGTESGQSVEEIFEAKEQQRRSGGGIFLWGIGNSIGPAIPELLRRSPQPEVLFSPMKAKPKQHDCTPSEIANWACGHDPSGKGYTFPNGASVTSRFDPQRPKFQHYALVCRSDGPLLDQISTEKLWLQNLVNLRSGRPVGGSQVTAVVEYRSVKNNCLVGAPYAISMRVHLVEPYVITLTAPLVYPQQPELG